MTEHKLHLKTFVGLCFCLSSCQSIALENTGLSFHGYARAGLATAEGNHHAAFFKAPGAGERYRLGNEPDVNLRLRLNYDGQHQNPNDTYFKAEAAAEDYRILGDTRNLKLRGVPKLNVTMANINNSGINLWVGRRWYDLQGSHLNKYRWMNSGKNTHAGMGIEGVKVGSATLNVAGFYHREKDVQSFSNNPSAANTQGILESHSLDVRVKNIVFGDNSLLNVWAIYTHRPADESLGYSRKSGWGGGAWLVTADSPNGYNRFGFSYRQGPTVTKNTANANPINESEGYNLSHAYQWELNNTYRWDDHQRFAIEWVAIAQERNFGEGGSHDAIRWYSAGVHPTFYLNDYWSIANEVGIDHVKNGPLDVTGTLTKAAIALQLQSGKRYVAQHTLRLFASYARWSSAFVGLIGNQPQSAPYGDDNHGWNVGLQIEHIW
ncbi:carbohydrate porin [Pseudomaricurvus sp.]|uniref:carbohydrate porin n=1 Tax=Pseudomaricurvus sp. TaxID=2004510 RepID=UPI003F6C018E